VAMQTFAIVIGLVQLDFLWRRWRAEIVDVNVPQTVQLRLKGAEHRIVGVARVAGLLGRDAMVLKMCGSQTGGIVNVEPIGGAIVQEIIDLAAVLNAVRVAIPPRNLTDF